VEQTLPRAPVSAQATIEIAASAREVWSVLADVAAWPTWNPAIREATATDELEVGSRFHFSTEMGTLRCHVTEVDAPRQFGWRGRVLSIGERQVWRLEPFAGGTRVEVEARMTGLAAWLFRRRLTERLDRVLDALVRLLQLEAEARAAEGPEIEASAGEAGSSGDTPGSPPSG
jgi:uncharacterized protein YndB with AHSA1/START domain